MTITTPDGTADGYFVRPSSGTAPGVLIWPDIFGLRPAFRQMAKRLAESGYAVLVVNPFYRTQKAPTAEKGTATPIGELRPLAQSLNETTETTDAKAFVAWLDAQPSVAKDRPIGTQGYCMGGPMAFRTSAAVPERVGAVATFHGGGLVTDKANSPHTRGGAEQGPVPRRDRRQRRRARAGRQDHAEGDLREGAPARRDRGLRGGRRTDGAPRTRPSTTSRKQREGVGKTPRALQGGPVERPEPSKRVRAKVGSRSFARLGLEHAASVHTLP